MLSSIKRLFSSVLGVLIILGCFLGWILFAGATHDLYKLQEIQGWSVQRGLITHSYARQVRVFRQRRAWDVEIAGTLIATGAAFNAFRIGYGFELSVLTRKRAERFAALYPVNRQLDVYVDPVHPASVVLVRDNSSRVTWMALWVGLLLGLLPVLLYGYGRLTGYQRD